MILLSHCFGVSREAIIRRLEELGLARGGTWDWFQAHGGITDEQAEQVLGPSSDAKGETAANGEHVPLRLALLAREAWKRSFYSEGQLARLLGLHRLEVRRLLDDAETERHEADELVRLSR